MPGICMIHIRYNLNIHIQRWCCAVSPSDIRYAGRCRMRVVQPKLHMSFPTTGRIGMCVGCKALDFCHVLLDFGDGFPWVKTLGACLGAVHDGVASVHAERISQLLLTFIAILITAICHPSSRLHQGSWAEVFVRVPPVRRARCAAARAQDALIHAWMYTRTNGHATLILTGARHTHKASGISCDSN